MARKLAVESRLAYHSAWACPLWGGLLCLVLLWRNTGIRERPKNVRCALRGWSAIAACVAFNDAGVVAGALCLVPLWCDSALGRQRKSPWNSVNRSRG